MIKKGRNSGLQKSEILFVATVIRDAEKLAWDDGQLLKRQRAVKSVIGSRGREFWRDEADFQGFKREEELEDELFKRHGWNKVDSGFRLWGGGAREDNRPKQDGFLQSKGWNNVDSGFRII